jgi:TRAP-type C4-dicarboxylate transport system substrate-binding protein
MVMSLAACAETDSGGQGGGSGVEAGATMEEYQAAFKDVDPITINAQSPSPKGSESGRDFDTYVANVEEWSDGKISFEVGYSNAVVEPADADDALADGRLDMAKVIPSYEPSEFPVSSALSNVSIVGDLSLVEGTLSSLMWLNEFALGSEDFMAEWADRDMKLIQPVAFSGTAMTFCSQPHDSLETFDGATIASGSSSWSAQLTALGASPVSLPFNETFEGLQRGVIECSMTGVSGATNSGVLEVAPNVTYDDSARSTANPSMWAVSNTAWESWPLIVQQLLWDRSVDLVQITIEKTFDAFSDVASQVRAAGGKISPFDDESRELIDEVNEDLLADLDSVSAISDADAWVDEARKLADEWADAPSEHGLAAEVSLADFDTWYASAGLDLTEYVNEAFAKIWGPLRPE